MSLKVHMVDSELLQILFFNRWLTSGQSLHVRQALTLRSTELEGHGTCPSTIISNLYSLHNNAYLTKIKHKCVSLFKSFYSISVFLSNASRDLVDPCFQIHWPFL